MATSVQVFVQVALLFCVVTTSMGGITDFQKSFTELEHKVKVSQEEIKSLHQIIEQLEKRLEQLEVKGEFVEVQTQPAVPAPQACLVRTILLLTIAYMGYRHCMISSPMSKWEESTLLNREWRL